MRRYRIDRIEFAEDAPELGTALVDAFGRKRRPLCLGKPDGVPNVPHWSINEWPLAQAAPYILAECSGMRLAMSRYICYIKENRYQK